MMIYCLEVDQDAPADPNNDDLVEAEYPCLIRTGFGLHLCKGELDARIVANLTALERISS